MSIKLWKEDDRPREKLYLKGKSAVSDSELLAILIGMGTREKSALDIAKEMLQDNDSSLDKLGKLSIKEMMRYKGIGQAKAISIAAALEIGNRRQSEPRREVKTIKSSSDSFQILQSYFLGLKQEEFYIVLLNRALKPLRIERISIGKTDATLVDIKIVVKLALDYLASSVIIAHNHPSGNLTPSSSDLALTQRVKEALLLFEIQLLDHLIFFEYNYFSFSDNRKF